MLVNIVFIYAPSCFGHCSSSPVNKEPAAWGLETGVYRLEKSEKGAGNNPTILTVNMRFGRPNIVLTQVLPQEEHVCEERA